MSVNSSVSTMNKTMEHKKETLCFDNSRKQGIFLSISLFHRAFRFTKFYLYQRMHLLLSYTKIT